MVAVQGLFVVGRDSLHFSPFCKYRGVVAERRWIKVAIRCVLWHNTCVFTMRNLRESCLIHSICLITRERGGIVDCDVFHVNLDISTCTIAESVNC